VRPSRTCVRFDPLLPFETWKAIGPRIATYSTASAWWLGDWLAFGQMNYGRRYEDAVAATGLDDQTLRNYAVVARRFASSRRRDSLSFQHHAEVCALSDDDQELWLDIAATRGWSKRELRRHIRATKDADASKCTVSTQSSSPPARTKLEDPPGFVLHLLRGFELVRDGEIVTLPMSAQRLVAFLGLRRRPLHRVHIAGTLWTDGTEEHANACLRTALWRLRRLRATVVAATSTHLCLSDAVRVDASDTAELAAAILHGEGSADDAVGSLAEAGELLPDWYDDWVVIEREQIRQLVMHALERLSADARAAGRFGEATEAALAAVAQEPLRESAHRLVVEAHLAEANPGEAIRHYRLFADLLHSTLGLEPSPLMEALMAGVRTSGDVVVM
jgi:DNA-binding SARP family transcriptional activator